MEELVENLPKSKSHSKWVILGLAGCVLLIVGSSLIIIKIVNHRNVATSTFPAAVLRQIHGFKFYYLKSGSSIGFVLQPDSISYQSGVLIFNMQGPAGKTLAFTEEATPPNYDISALQADKQYTNLFGQAFITDLSDRTTGTLFTHDKTWVLINAPQPIGADLMQQILDTLTPQ